MNKSTELTYKCKSLEETIKGIPYMTTELTETAAGCSVDFNDIQLRRKLLEDTGGEFGAVFSSKGSAVIGKDNKIYADIPVNLYAKKKWHMQEKIGEIIPKACLIKAIHIHDSLIPAIHIHLECDISSKVDLANTIKETNKISRKIAGLGT